MWTDGIAILTANFNRYRLTYPYRVKTVTGYAVTAAHTGKRVRLMIGCAVSPVGLQYDVLQVCCGYLHRASPRSLRPKV